MRDRDQIPYHKSHYHIIPHHIITITLPEYHNHAPESYHPLIAKDTTTDSSAEFGERSCAEEDLLEGEEIFFFSSSSSSSGSPNNCSATLFFHSRKRSTSGRCHSPSNPVTIHSQSSRKNSRVPSTRGPSDPPAPPWKSKNR